MTDSTVVTAGGSGLRVSKLATICLRSRGAASPRLFPWECANKRELCSFVSRSGNYLGDTMSRYRQMELLCRQHADLDKKTADSWLEEAEIWSKLETIEHRLQLLKQESKLVDSRRKGKSAQRKS
jgi:hypothetical protein